MELLDIDMELYFVKDFPSNLIFPPVLVTLTVLLPEVKVIDPPSTTFCHWFIVTEYPLISAVDPSPVIMNSLLSRVSVILSP